VLFFRRPANAFVLDVTNATLAEDSVKLQGG